MAQSFETDQRRPEGTRGVISETVERTQEKLEGAGKAVQERMDRTRTAAADKLGGVATSLHERGDRAGDIAHRAADKLEGVATSLHERGDRAGDIAHRAADKMESTARYMRDHDIRSMLGDAEAMVRRRPGQSLFVAAVIGFLVGRALRSSD